MPNPQDPIFQAINADAQEAMADPSRAEVIMRMLPRLVGADAPQRPIGNYSGLPQSGEQAFADVNALAGQAPSGVGTDVRMGTSLGDVYAQRAQLQQRGDIASNELAIRDAVRMDEMTRARATQGMDALKYVQDDRRIAATIAQNARSLASDGRLRLQFIFENAKQIGEPDSPAAMKYQETAAALLRDPRTQAALMDPGMGMAAMTEVIDKSLAAARQTGGQPAAAPAAPPMPPAPMPGTGSSRSDVVSSIVGAQAATPATFPRVSPQEQAGRDQGRVSILRDELAAEEAKPPSPERDRNIMLLRREIGGASQGAFTFRQQAPGESTAKYGEAKERAYRAFVDDQRAADEQAARRRAEDRNAPGQVAEAQTKTADVEQQRQGAITGLANIAVAQGALGRIENSLFTRPGFGYDARATFQNILGTLGSKAGQQNATDMQQVYAATVAAINGARGLFPGSTNPQEVRFMEQVSLAGAAGVSPEQVRRTWEILDRVYRERLTALGVPKEAIDRAVGDATGALSTKGQGEQRKRVGGVWYVKRNGQWFAEQ